MPEFLIDAFYWGSVIAVYMALRNLVKIITLLGQP